MKIGRADFTSRNKVIQSKRSGRISSIGFLRSGGAGDILMSTPIIRALKGKYKGCDLTYFTKTENFPLLKGNKYIDHLANIESQYHGPGWPDYRTDPVDVDKFDLFFNLEGKLEQYVDEVNRIPRIDAIAKLCDITISDYRLIIPKDRQAEKWAEEFCKQKLSPEVVTIGFSPFARFRLRSWFEIYAREFVSLFDKTFYRLILLGDDSDRGFESSGLINTCGLLTLEQSIALTKRCDFFVTVDTLFLHLTAGFDIPTLALFGSLPPEIRIKNYNRCRAIVAEEVPCVPCWEWQAGEKRHRNVCINQVVRCMRALKPLRVYHKALEYMNELKLAKLIPGDLISWED